VWTWGVSVAQMYRISMDHLPFFNLPSVAAGVGIGQGTVQIAEWMAQLQPSRWTKPFGWMDPDFLMTLWGGTMDFTASRTEFSLWAMWAAPLLVATDVRRMSDEKRAIIMNEEVIAVNQDALAHAADRLRNDSATGEQLWARPLANGDQAVLLFHNCHPHGPPRNLSVSWVDLGWPPDTRRAVRDLWAREDRGIFTTEYVAVDVPCRDVAMLRISDVAAPSDGEGVRVAPGHQKSYV